VVGYYDCSNGWGHKKKNAKERERGDKRGGRGGRERKLIGNASEMDRFVVLFLLPLLID